jgi:hypothetical protein
MARGGRSRPDHFGPGTEVNRFDEDFLLKFPDLARVVGGGMPPTFRVLADFQVGTVRDIRCEA